MIFRKPTITISCFTKLQFIIAANFVFFLFHCASLEDLSQSKVNDKLLTTQIEVLDDSSRVKKLLQASNELFHERKYKEVIEKTKEANSILPTEEGYYLLGLSHYKIDDPQNAKIAFETGLAINSKNEQILSVYATTLTALGEEENARNVYRRLVEYFPEKEIYIFKLAISLKSLKLFSESLLTFKKIDEDSFNLKSQLCMHMGDVYFEMKKYSLAEEYYEKAKNLDPNLLEAQDAKLGAKFAQAMFKGRASFDNKKYSEAITHFANATSLSPGNFLGFLFLGKAYFENNQLEEAEENFKKSLFLEKKEKEVYSLLSALYLKQGRFHKSIATLQSAIEIFPRDREFYNQLGISYKQLGNSKLALLSFIKATELDKTYIDAKKNLAFTFLEEDQKLEAKRELRELQELVPSDKIILDALSFLEQGQEGRDGSEKNNAWKKKRILATGRAYEDKKEFEKAEKFYQDRYKKKFEKEPAAHRLSLLYLEMSQLEKEKANFNRANFFLEKAKAYNPYNSQIRNLEFALKQSSKTEEASSYIKKGDLFYEANDYLAALAEYTKSFAIQKKSSTLIKIFNAYLELGQKEKCLSFLLSTWKNELPHNTDILETIGSLYQKLGQESLAINAFQEILKKNPESYFSYYQLGIQSLSIDRQASLLNFEKAIALYPGYASAYIARGITYYKLGNRERSRDDFRYALSLESNLEIASYNLGMILYNDNLFKDAESIFLDLTQKFPDFADPYYHLGYMYYEQKDFVQAEKYILTSLRLDRNPTTIYAYIKILEQIRKSNSKREGLDSLIQSLKKEIVEKYPNSSYAKNLSDIVFKQKDNRVVMQSYPLLDSIISPPIFINQSLIVNYGTSISRLGGDTKSILWRVETPSPYQDLKANTRLYGLSKTHLDQLDLETGKLLWHIALYPNANSNLHISDSILYSATMNGSEIIYSYSLEGDLQAKLNLELGSKWELTTSGNLFVFHRTDDTMSWEIYDSKLNLIKTTLTLIGSEKGDIFILGSIGSSCFVLKGLYIYRFEANGLFARSPRLKDQLKSVYFYKNTIHMQTDTGLFALSEKLEQFEKLQSIEKNQTEILVGDNTYLSSEGILIMRDKSGKLIWSENLSKRADKGKSGVYSVYFKR